MYFAIIRVDSACQIRLFSRLQGQSIGTEDHGLYGEFGRFLGVLSLGFKVGGGQAITARMASIRVKKRFMIILVLGY